MKKNVLLTVISIVIIALQIAVETVAAVLICKLNVLPNHLFLIVLAIFVLLTAVTGGLLFIPIKKRIGIARRIIAFVLAAIVILGCVIVSKLVYDAYYTIYSITGNDDDNGEFYINIYVAEEDNAKTLNDIARYKFGIVKDYDSENIATAIQKIKSVTAIVPDVSEFESMSALADAFLNKEIQN